MLPLVFDNLFCSIMPALVQSRLSLSWLINNKWHMASKGNNPMASKKQGKLWH